jgi:hypothetical protein
MRSSFGLTTHCTTLGHEVVRLWSAARLSCRPGSPPSPPAPPHRASEDTIGARRGVESVATTGPAHPPIGEGGEGGEARPDDRAQSRTRCCHGWVEEWCRNRCRVVHRTGFVVATTTSSAMASDTARRPASRRRRPSSTPSVTVVVSISRVGNKSKLLRRFIVPVTKPCFRNGLTPYSGCFACSPRST